jgi:hypothetical protein
MHGLLRPCFALVRCKLEMLLLPGILLQLLSPVNLSFVLLRVNFNVVQSKFVPWRLVAISYALLECYWSVCSSETELHIHVRLSELSILWKMSTILLSLFVHLIFCSSPYISFPSPLPPPPPKNEAHRKKETPSKTRNNHLTRHVIERSLSSTRLLRICVLPARSLPWAQRSAGFEN